MTTRTSRDELQNAAEHAVQDWAARAGKNDVIPPQLWVIKNGRPERHSLEHLFDGGIPKDMSGAELVPVLRQLGISEAAVIVSMVETRTLVVNFPRPGVIVSEQRELALVDVADLETEEARVAEVVRVAGKPVIGSFSRLTGDVVMWPLSRLLQEAHAPSSSPLRAGKRRIGS
jgi:hypothetical protein